MLYANTCASHQMKPHWTPKSYKTVMRRLNLKLYPEQERIFAALHGWRDRTARRLDEGMGFIMSNDCMMHLAKAAGTGTTVSHARMEKLVEAMMPVTRTDVKELARVIIDAKGVDNLTRSTPVLATPAPDSRVEAGADADTSFIRPGSDLPLIHQAKQPHQLSIPPLSRAWGGAGADSSSVCHYSAANASCTLR